MITRLLIANRGEIAVRIMATASVLGIETVGVYAAADAACGHVGRADAAVELPGMGPAAYLDVAAVVVAATSAGCDTLHPGYGFASERPQLAARCAEAGVRPVTRASDLAGAMRRCASEAAAAFGDGRVYVEQLLTRARHVEVQVIGDGTGAVTVLGDRDCSLQRRRQKLVEIAPAPIGDQVVGLCRLRDYAERVVNVLVRVLVPAAGAA